jgi:hypothetical protein
MSSLFLMSEDARKTETELRTIWPLFNNGVTALPVERRNYGSRGSSTLFTNTILFFDTV